MQKIEGEFMSSNKVIEHDKEDVKWYSLTVDETVAKLNVDKNFGLKNDEAARRLQEEGFNIIPKVKGSIWEIYLSPLFNWLINIYLIISGILIITSIWIPTVWGQVSFYLIIVAFNMGFTIFQQIRAQFKLDALHKLSAPTSTVIRDGVPMELKASELVPGDIIELEEGDRIPADARIVYASNLLVNESALTGESVAVDKTTEPRKALPKKTSISERNNMVFTGTYVEYGRVTAVVVETGKGTELGKLSTELEKIGTNEIPLTNKVNKLAKWLGLTVLGYIVISFTYILILHALRNDWEIESVMKNLVNSLTTSMAIMPISIPLLTTLILLTGVLTMAKNRVIVRNISGVETLGRCSVLCSDKTGTITSNKMTIKRIWDTEQLYGVSGTGFAKDGVIYPMDAGNGVDLSSERQYLLPNGIQAYYKGGNLQYLLIGGMLNNNAHLIIEDVFQPHQQTSWKTTGDPTDGAFLALFNKSALNEKEIKKRFGYVKEYTFDSELKRMSKIYQNDEGYILFCKGATETVLPLCTRMGGRKDHFPLTEEKKERIMNHVNHYASEGYRVISLAMRPFEQDPLIYEDRKELEQDLIYNGFVCMLDPPRYKVDEAVDECHRAGILPIMITGDSLETAKAIAQSVNILKKGGKVVSGDKIPEMNEKEFFEVRVFARVSPQHKQEIVNKYKEKNKIVAMTGDGVNDALALTNADVGIAMGIEGTDVAKQASDVVIADDSFTSTVLGIREGRGLFEKIRIMIFFYIAVNIAEALVYFPASFLVFSLENFQFVNDFQRVIIFSTAHTIPPFALIFDTFSSDIMKYPPRDNEEIFNKKYVGALTVLAVSLAIVAGGIYLLTYFGMIPYLGNAEGISNIQEIYHQRAQTMFVMVIVFSESLLILVLRRMNKSVAQSIKEDWNWKIMTMVVIVPIGHVILMYLKPFQTLVTNVSGLEVGYATFGLLDWLIVLITMVLPLIALEIYKKAVRDKNAYF